MQVLYNHAVSTFVLLTAEVDVPDLKSQFEQGYYRVPIRLGEIPLHRSSSPAVNSAAELVFV